MVVEANNEAIIWDFAEGIPLRTLGDLRTRMKQ